MNQTRADLGIVERVTISGIGYYILFDGKGGEFAFGCVTGAIYGAGDTDAIEFTWDGNDEMDEVSGDGWAELQPDGSITGQI